MLRGEPIWQTSSTGPTSMPSSSDAVATSAFSSPARKPRLDAVAAVLRQDAVVRGDDVVTQPLAELVREPFGEAARVHEHERRAVLATSVGDPVEHVAHLLGARDGFELTLGQLDGEVELALVAAVDDGGHRPIADEQPGNGLDRPLRRRQADAGRAARRTTLRAARA